MTGPGPTLSILLVTAYFPPDTGSAAHLFYELGTELANRGHEVTVLTSLPGYYARGDLSRYRGRRRVRERVRGMDVIRVATPEIDRTSMIGRARWHFGGAWRFFREGLRLPAHDVSLVYSPPLPLGLTAWGLRLFKGTPFVLNVQDLFPQSIIDLGLLENRWIIRAFRWLEGFVYRRSDVITVHSDGNREKVVAAGAPPERVRVTPNWVDTDFIRPGERLNDFRSEHGLGDDMVVSFAGVLGHSQDLDTVLEAARILEDREKLTWLIVGDGVERERIEHKACALGLENVCFLDMQPRERYPAVLHASDVTLATLKADVATPVVPSKIMSSMAAGRPVVAAMDPSGDAPELIRKAECGVAVPPEDPGALAEAVAGLLDDDERREAAGRAGRRFAEEALSLRGCTDRYVSLFFKAVDRGKTS